MDYQAALYNPIYLALGVPATIALANSVGTVSLTAIDKTGGVEIPGAGSMVESIRPAAVIRMAELLAAGVARADLDGGEITLNGSTWGIVSTRPSPSPKGEADGELFLILEE